MNYSLLLNITLLAVVLWLTRNVTAKGFAAKTAAPAPNGGQPSENGAPAPSPWTKRLDITGATPVPGIASAVVASYGIARDRIVDLAAYATPGFVDTFPDDVKGCLKDCYANGNAVGFDTMAVASGQASLNGEQALYFALLYKGPNELPFIKVFVDKIKAS